MYILRYSITEVPDGVWGDFANTNNVTFTGLVGQLQRKVLIVTVLLFSVTHESTLGHYHCVF